MNEHLNDGIAIRLRMLRDIEGVLGSFVIGERGHMLGRDVPSACGTDVLQLVGGRVQQLCDAFVGAQIGGGFECTTLYFQQHKLHVRALGNAFLIVVSSADVNLPALKMAVNMVGRQVLSDFAAAAEEERRSAVHVPRSSDVPLRSYRGRLVSR